MPILEFMLATSQKLVNLQKFLLGNISFGAEAPVPPDYPGWPGITCAPRWPTFFCNGFWHRFLKAQTGSWHRKTSKTGAQNPPEIQPKTFRNRSYVANAEKWIRANTPTLLLIFAVSKRSKIVRKSYKKRAQIQTYLGQPLETPKIRFLSFLSSFLGPNLDLCWELFFFSHNIFDLRDVAFLSKILLFGIYSMLMEIASVRLRLIRTGDTWIKKWKASFSSFCFLWALTLH